MPGSSLSDRVASLDWDCADKETRYLTHAIHRYSGKFIPQIAGQAIELLTRPGEVVLDPYCGSGTTLLEASIRGRHSVGVDVNPLAVLVSRVKTTPIPEVALADLLVRFDSVVNEARGTPSLWTAQTQARLMSGSLADERLRDRWFTKWFQPSALSELVIISVAIRAMPASAMRDLALVAFSDILRRSSNAHQGYPNVMFDKNRRPADSPARMFRIRLQEVCSDVRSLQLSLADGVTGRVVLGDATRLPFENGTFDAIVTHPPYIGSVPYAEYGVLSLKWLGVEPGALERQLTGGRRRSPDVVNRFRAGFAGMLHESWRTLKPGRILFMLVGSPVVRGAQIDMAAMAKELADEAGFSLVSEARRNGTNRRANRMPHETLLFFEKSNATATTYSSSLRAKPSENQMASATAR